MSLYRRLAEEKLRAMRTIRGQEEENYYENILEIYWYPRSGKAILVFTNGDEKIIYKVYVIEVDDASGTMPFQFTYDNAKKAVSITLISSYDGSQQPFNAEYDSGTLYLTK